MKLAFVLLLAMTATTAVAAGPDYETIFAGRDACFELYDLKAGKLVARYGGERCAARTSPCSTFKVPLSLMAFDAGLLQDETSGMKWDGIERPRASWNRDQTARTWMQESVVWFSQYLVAKLGAEKVKEYLGRFDYGNQDISGGLPGFWLESSLQISPDEQLRFWEKFWREQLPVSEHAFAMTKKITFIETSGRGWTLHGKTGSGTTDEAGSYWNGWFAGHLAKGDRELVFVTSFTDKEPQEGERPAGQIAREMSEAILKKLGYY